MLELWMRHCEAVLFVCKSRIVIPGLWEPVLLLSVFERGWKLSSPPPGIRAALHEGLWPRLPLLPLQPLAGWFPFTLEDSFCASFFLPSFSAPPLAGLHPSRSAALFTLAPVSRLALMVQRPQYLESSPWAHPPGSGMKLTATSKEQIPGVEVRSRVLGVLVLCLCKASFLSSPVTQTAFVRFSSVRPISLYTCCVLFIRELISQGCHLVVASRKAARLGHSGQSSQSTRASWRSDFLTLLWFWRLHWEYLTPGSLDHWFEGFSITVILWGETDKWTYSFITCGSLIQPFFLGEGIE